MLKIAFKYLKYYITSVGPHGIHSPFVYELATKVLADKGMYSGCRLAEVARRQMLKDDTLITVADFGAGAGNSGQKSYQKTIAQIALSSAKPPKYARLLYLLCARYRPKYMLELGTSLGISGIYQAVALEAHDIFDYKFITLEGSESIANIARQNFITYGNFKNIEVGVGNFDETLPAYLQQFPRLDYVFFDGNHRYQPTINYFNQCLPLVHEDTLFIFDDIRWSAEMEQAWEEIKQHPQVTVTVDLFFMGLVFFKTGQAKQHFVVRY